MHFYPLSYLKNNPLQDYHGATFGMTQPQCNVWIHLWWFSEDSFRYLAQKLNVKVSFFDFTKYFKKHPQESVNIKNLPSGTFVFENGKM
ncbi:hypothetical protein FACS1894162_3010 [Bacteroidia bacterium]|nr:hypothetical protein FACS1894162_3010 [Bacteroidia bacterium]